MLDDGERKLRAMWRRYQDTRDPRHMPIVIAEESIKFVPPAISVPPRYVTPAGEIVSQEWA